MNREFFVAVFYIALWWASIAVARAQVVDDAGSETKATETKQVEQMVIDDIIAASPHVDDVVCIAIQVGTIPSEDLAVQLRRERAGALIPSVRAYAERGASWEDELWGATERGRDRIGFEIRWSPSDALDADQGSRFVREWRANQSHQRALAEEVVERYFDRIQILVEERIISSRPIDIVRRRVMVAQLDAWLEAATAGAWSQLLAGEKVACPMSEAGRTDPAR